MDGDVAMGSWPLDPLEDDILGTFALGGDCHVSIESALHKEVLLPWSVCDGLNGPSLDASVSPSEGQWEAQAKPHGSEGHRHTSAPGQQTRDPGSTCPTPFGSAALGANTQGDQGLPPVAHAGVLPQEASSLATMQWALPGTTPPVDENLPLHDISTAHLTSALHVPGPRRGPSARPEAPGEAGSFGNLAEPTMTHQTSCESHHGQSMSSLSLRAKRHWSRRTKSVACLTLTPDPASADPRQPIGRTLSGSKRALPPLQQGDSISAVELLRAAAELDSQAPFKMPRGSHVRGQGNRPGSHFHRRGQSLAGEADMSGHVAASGVLTAPFGMGQPNTLNPCGRRGITVHPHFSAPVSVSAQASTSALRKLSWGALAPAAQGQPQAAAQARSAAPQSVIQRLLLASGVLSSLAESGSNACVPKVEDGTPAPDLLPLLHLLSANLGGAPSAEPSVAPGALPQIDNVPGGKECKATADAGSPHLDLKPADAGSPHLDLKPAELGFRQPRPRTRSCGSLANPRLKCTTATRLKGRVADKQGLEQLSPTSAPGSDLSSQQGEPNMCAGPSNERSSGRRTGGGDPPRIEEAGEEGRLPEDAGMEGAMDEGGVPLGETRKAYLERTRRERLQHGLKKLRRLLGGSGNKVQVVERAVKLLDERRRLRDQLEARVEHLQKELDSLRKGTRAVTDLQ